MGDLNTGTGRLSPPAGTDLTFQAYIYFGLLILAVFTFISLSVKHVTVRLGDRTASYFTFAPTVRDVVREVGMTGKIGLDKAPASLTESETADFYTVSEDLAAEVTNGMVIQISCHRIKKVTERISSPAPVQREWDIFLEPGMQRVSNPGKSGTLENTLLVHYRDGALVSRRQVGSRVITPPRPRVIADGSYETVSRQIKIQDRRPVEFIATAYTYTGYRTAVGAKTRRGVVAVDPKVIRLGTRMYIEGYGYAVAADTGGAIKGKKIDVFLETRQDALKWGRRRVNVYIL